jgi:nicotinate-nucleotide adenylyltransferase
LGGTFNPVHLGHLVLAEQAREALRLEKIIFIPSGHPPHKKASGLAPARQRYQMAALAVKGNPYFEVSDLEISRGGISYSIETVKELKSVYCRAKLYFIVGSDFLKEAFSWKNIDSLGKISKFAVAARPGYSFTKLPANMQGIRVDALDISATDIRKRIKLEKSIRYLVPEEVRKYILKKKLYC